jgi:hypothetical protein
MADTKHIYNAEDMHRYFSGKMNAAEMHAMEKAALNDPLLADAMEGYHSLPVKDFTAVQKQLDELKEKISNKTVSIKKYNDKWWKVAAAVLLLVGSVFAFFKIHNTNNITKQETVANTPQLKTTRDTIVSAKQNDSLVTTNITAPKNDSAIAMVNLKATKNYAAANKIQIKKNVPVTEYDSVVATEFASADKENKPSVFEHDENPAVSKRSEKKAIAFAGKVIDADNNAIPFANLIINNHQQAKTDAKGLFNLSLQDSVIRLDIAAQNYFPSTTNITANNFANIVLTAKKNTLKKSQSLTDTFTRSIVQVLYKLGVEPKEGWEKYRLFLVDQLSNSEYDDGRRVIGTTIVRFEINRDMQPTNFSFEKSIDEDVNDAIENLILIGPEWRLAEHGGVPGIVELKIIF